MSRSKIEKIILKSASPALREFYKNGKKQFEVYTKIKEEGYKNKMNLNNYYGLSAMTPYKNRADFLKLSVSMKESLKETLKKGDYLTPDKTDQLRVAMQESSWLYSQITHLSVKELSGNAYSMGKRQLHSGRRISDRFRRKLSLNGSPYELQETDSYISLLWSDFVNIAGFVTDDKFDELVSDFFHEAMALDALRIGFNGRFASPETDPDTWPMGEDVNKGWHEVAKEYANGSQVLTDSITLGEGGDFKSLDSLANHLIETRIPRDLRDNSRLVVLVGAELARQERLKLFDGSASAADAVSAQAGLERIAGRFAMVPPFMPGKRLVITPLSNLHIYTQEGSEFYREGESDSREYFWSLLRMEGYGLEDCSMYAAADEGAISLI